MVKETVFFNNSKNIPESNPRGKLEAQADSLFGDQKERALAIFSEFEKLGLGLTVYTFLIRALTGSFGTVIETIKFVGKNPTSGTVDKNKRAPRVLSALEDILKKHKDNKIKTEEIQEELFWAIQKFP